MLMLYSRLSWEQAERRVSPAPATRLSVSLVPLLISPVLLMTLTLVCRCWCRWRWRQVWGAGESAASRTPHGRRRHARLTSAAANSAG